MTRVWSANGKRQLCPARHPGEARRERMRALTGGRRRPHLRRPILRTCAPPALPASLSDVHPAAEKADNDGAMTAKPSTRWRGVFHAFAVAALLCAAAGAVHAQVNYPRPCMPGQIHGDGRPYLNADGTLNVPVIDAVSRYEQALLDVSPVTEYHPEILAAIRVRNPGIKMLAYATGENIYDVNAADSSVHFPTRYNHMIRDLGGFLYDRQGNPYTNYDINLAKRDVNGRYVVAEAIAQLFYDVVGRSGLWDGMFIDVYCDDIRWSETPSESIDVVRAGYPNETAFAAAYRAGSDTLAARLRQYMGPDFTLVGNCAVGTKYAWFNGWTREDFPFQDGGTWQVNMNRDPGGILVDEARFRQPTANQIVSRWDEIDPYDATNMRKVRFGLGTSALTTAFHQIGVTDRSATSVATEQWWYDEYAVDLATHQASTDLSHARWLGQALGPAYQMIWAGTNPDACSNPGFETDVTSGWTFGLNPPGSATITRDASTAAVGAASAHIHITTTGVNLWDVSLASIGSITMVPGANFTSTFWAKASAARDLILVANSNTGGGELARGTVTLGTSWKQYQVELAPSQMGNARLVFYLGQQQPGDLWLDDVHFQMGDTNLWRRDFEHGSVLVNPALSTLTVPLEKTFYKIAGLRDPATNDGSTVNSVTVPASDALFLIAAPRDTIPPAAIQDARVSP
jgi:hypothetical protein